MSSNLKLKKGKTRVLASLILLILGATLLCHSLLAFAGVVPPLAVVGPFRVVNAVTGVPVAGAYIMVYAALPGGGTIPWDGYTDSNGYANVDIGGSGSVLGWSVSATGYYAKSGQGYPPAVIQLYPIGPHPTQTPTPTSTPASTPTPGPTQTPALTSTPQPSTAPGIFEFLMANLVSLVEAIVGFACVVATFAIRRL